MPNAMPSENSTNVRIKNSTGRALGLAAGVWALAVALAAFDGVFARLPVAVDLALAAFATLFAAGAYVLDAEVRARVEAAPVASVAFVAFLGDGLLAGLAWQGVEVPVRGAGALLAFFGMPLALAANLPALAAAARRLRSAVARRPGARPAAT